MSQEPSARPYPDPQPEATYPEPGVPARPGTVVLEDDILIIDEPAPVGPATTTPPASGPPDHDELARSDADLAKDEATKVGQSAADAGKKVAGTAKEEAGNVAAEARTQAKDVLGQARTEVRDQAQTQKQRVSSGLHSISRELGSMADRSEESGVATDLARQAAQGARDVASWLEQRDPNDLLADVRSFARRRPGAFLGIALAAGVVAGRLTRGLKDDDVPASPVEDDVAGGSL